MEVRMSGGRFNYSDSSLMSDMFPGSWSSENKRLIRDNPYEDQEISELMYDLLQLTHDLDWYLSCDTSEPTYLEAKRKFKEKWFGTVPEYIVSEIKVADGASVEFAPGV